MIMHEYGGAITFGILVLFWLNAVTHRTGTRLGALLPWGSPARLAALWADLKAHLGALFHLRAPPPRPRHRWPAPYTAQGCSHDRHGGKWAFVVAGARHR